MVEYKYEWICECTHGWCPFDTKREAYDHTNTKFCGRRLSIKKKRVSTNKFKHKTAN